MLRKNEGQWTLILDTYLFAMILNVNRQMTDMHFLFPLSMSFCHSHLFINITESTSMLMCPFEHLKNVFFFLNSVCVLTYLVKGRA